MDIWRFLRERRRELLGLAIILGIGAIIYVYYVYVPPPYTG